MASFPGRAYTAAHRLALAGAAMMCLCSGACSHRAPYEAAGEVQVAPDDRRRILAPSPIAAPDYSGLRYVSKMHESLERVDAQRVALYARIGQIGSERDLYDAALWLSLPLLAFSPAPRDVTKGGALLGAGYGYLNTRPKDEVAILYDTIGQLTCLMVAYAPYLYTTRDFGAPGPDGKHSQRYAALVDALRAFETETGVFLDAVPPRSPVTDTSGARCISDPSSACGERKKLHARTTPGNQRQIDLVRFYVDERSQEASDEARRLARLEETIVTIAPGELDRLAALVQGAGGRLLAGARPAPLDPGPLIAGRPRTPDARAASTASTAVSQSGTQAAHPGAGLPPLAAPNEAARTLRTRADAADRALADARRAALTFITEHEARIEAAERESRAYCTRYPALPRAATVPGAASAADPGGR